MVGTDVSTQQQLAVIRLVIVIAAMVVIIRNRCAPNNLLYSIPYIAWLVHAVIYLVAYLALSCAGLVSAVVFNVWGAGLQIQGYLTVLMVEIARWQRQKNKQGAGSGC